MSVIGALLLVVVGAAGLVAAWNALHPVGDHTRRYSISWLPAMVATEVAPLLAVVQAVALGAGLALGAVSNPAGWVGVGLIVVSLGTLGVVRVRSLTGVRRLRRLIDDVVHPARGWARLVGRPVPTPPGVVEHRGIAWRNDLTLDLIVPASHQQAASTAPLPVCVYVHGGGWTGGDPHSQGRDLYHTLALAGWATATIRYPLAPQASVEEQVAAVRSAVRWVRSDLADHGIQPAAVVLAGGSAGAHLASLAALTPTGPDERVDALVGLYGVYDMANRNQIRAHWPKVRNVVMKASVEEAPERYRALSPLDQIHNDTPPVLVVHGTNDTLVPLAESEQFARALIDAGRPVELVPVIGAQHGFDAFSSVASRTVAAVIRDWLHRTVNVPVR